MLRVMAGGDNISQCTGSKKHLLVKADLPTRWALVGWNWMVSGETWFCNVSWEYDVDYCSYHQELLFIFFSERYD